MSQPVTKLPPVLALQIRNAAMKTTQIDAVADHLAALMSELHAFDLVADVSHELGAEYILIRRSLKKDRRS